MKKWFTLPLLGLLASSPAMAASASSIIQKIQRGDKSVLAKISIKDFRKIHSYKNTDYYVPRKIGQKALRSLFGCLRNTDKDVRFFCAQYLYQLELNHLHRKLILKYYKRETHWPAKLALQDVLVLINEDRFEKARDEGDAEFLAKVKFSEISEFIEKGFPAEGEEFTMGDFKFLSGGLKNRQTKIRIFSVQMMGRIEKPSNKVKKLLQRLKRKEKGKAILKEIDISLKCINKPKKCPDVKIYQYE